MSVYIQQSGACMPFCSSESWVVLNPIEQSIKKKIETQGTPLNKWNVSINYGIKTGLNDAFIVSGEVKDQLIAEDSKSAEIIRPILRGRDIKRYNCNYADLWVLYIPWHFPLENDDSITGPSEEAEKMFREQYPAVYTHLLRHKEELSKRNVAETGIRYEWYALQRWGAKYRDDFSKPKIVWGNLCLSAQFAFVDSDCFINAPSPMIVPGNKYLLAILNSKIADWYIRQLGVTRNGGYFEYKPMFVEQLPVPLIDDTAQQPFIRLVDQVLSLKNSGGDTAEIENEINRLAYQLYGLEKNEVQYIESHESG